MMSIPEVPFFQELLADISTEKKDGELHTLHFSSLPVGETTYDVVLRALPPVYYPPKHHEAIEALLNKIREALNKRGHICSEETPKLVLALVLHHDKSKKITINSINKTLASMRLSDVYQFFIFGSRPPKNWTKSRIIQNSWRSFSLLPSFMKPTTHSGRVLLSFQALKNFKHNITIAPIVRFYDAAWRTLGDERDAKVEELKEFTSVRTCSGFSGSVASVEGRARPGWPRPQSAADVPGMGEKTSPTPKA